MIARLGVAAFTDLSNVPIWIVPVVACLITLLLLAALLRQADALPLDHPNERSLHSRPTPRIGGLALIPGCVVAWLFAAGDTVSPIVSGGVILFALSIMDDRHGLPIPLRFGVHLLVAGALATWLATSLAFAIVGALAIAWATNLYNFMDGANGLAGGMAAIGFAAFGFAAPVDSGIPALSFSLGGAALGFLVFNFDPAKVFLGDAGSISLGFLAGGLSMLGVVRDDWPLWFPVLVFSPFIVDATATLLRRVLRGERFWHAHREHYYQRLVRMGWSHRRLAIAEYALMAAAASSALLLMNAGTTAQAAFLLAWCAIYLVIMFIIDHRWKNFGGIA